MTVRSAWAKWVTRWLARVDGVQGHLKLGMLALTGVSTATITLRQYGHSQYAWPLIAVICASMPIYTYLYTEGGAWNQVARDKQDLSDNYSHPAMRIDDELIGVAVFAAIHKRPPDEEEQAAIAEAVDDTWHTYRDGVTIDPDGD